MFGPKLKLKTDPLKSGPFEIQFSISPDFKWSEFRSSLYYDCMSIDTCIQARIHSNKDTKYYDGISIDTCIQAMALGDIVFVRHRRSILCHPVYEFSWKRKKKKQLNICHGRFGFVFEVLIVSN